MTTIGDTSYEVGIKFDNSTITIGGESIDTKLSSFASKTHTHNIADISDLSTKLTNLEDKNYIEQSLNGDVSITGQLTCDDVNFTYDGIETSLAEKFALIDSNITSNTIEHLTLTKDSNVKVGYPVFITGEIVGKDLNSLLITSKDCVPLIKSTGDYQSFVGVCTEVNATHHRQTTTTINGQVYAYTRYATHGDFLFHVDDSSKYKVGDIIKFDGSIIDIEENVTYKNMKSMVGTVTAIKDATTVAIFRF